MCSSPIDGAEEGSKVYGDDSATGVVDLEAIVFYDGIDDLFLLRRKKWGPFLRQKMKQINNYIRNH